MRLRAVAVSVVFVLVFLFTASHVFAEDGNEFTVRVTSSPRPVNALFGLFRTDDRKESPEPSESPKPFRLKLDRLKEIGLKVCEEHQEEITTRSESLAKLVSNMISKFDAIASRVEEYYNSKVLPSNKVVSNYDELVKDVAAKKALVETDLAGAQKDVADFSCTGDNPKGQITQYRMDMQIVKKDLQAYRTSIKNLILAIKSLNGEGEKESSSSSANPI